VPPLTEPDPVVGCPPRVSWLFLGVAPVADLVLGLFPGTVGQVALGLAILVAVLGLILGVILNRPPDPATWMLALGCETAFLIGIALRGNNTAITSVDFGPLSPDLWTFVGYLLMMTFFIIMVRRHGDHRSDAFMTLDSLMVTLGVAAPVWALLVVPALARKAQPVDVLVLGAAYPIMDTLLVALAVQIVFRRIASSPTAAFLLAAVSLLLVGDFGYELVATDHLVGLAPRFLQIAFLSGFVAVGAGALHPSMRELSAPGRGSVATANSRPRALLTLAAMVPAVLPMTLPASSGSDQTVRVILGVSLLAIVCLRLLRSMSYLDTIERSVAHLATHDEFTGLANRSALVAVLPKYLAEATTSLIILEVNDFFFINGTYGHDLGDRVIAESARRLTSRAGDHLVVRLDGGKFAVLTAGPALAARRLSEHLRAMLAQPFDLGEGPGEKGMSVSVGIASAEIDEDIGAEALLRDAQLALFHVQKSGKPGIALFDGELRTRATERLALSRDLRGALERNEMTVFYQPILSADGVTLVGFEALLRWTSLEHGPISPVVFIPIAEETGLIGELGDWVMRQACAQISTWRSIRPDDDLHVAVNVSPQQLLTGDLRALVEMALDEHGLPASALWLEITESILVDSDTESVDTLVALRTMGLTLAIDDFGTGYSALSYLKRMPVQVVKIDRSFVNGVGIDKNDDAIVQAAITMSHTLGMSVIAEGVETEIQAKTLRELGCDMFQGYLYSRPVPAAEVQLEAFRSAADPVPTGPAPENSIA